MASQGARRIDGVVANALSRGFARNLAQEALGPAVACGAGVLGFARVFVLSRGVVAAAVIANLGVSGTVADRDFVPEAVAAGTLREWFRVDSDLHGDALVVHVGWFCEKLTECRAGCVVDHNVNGAGGRVGVGGRV